MIRLDGLYASQRANETKWLRSAHEHIFHDKCSCKNVWKAGCQFLNKKTWSLYLWSKINRRGYKQSWLLLLFLLFLFLFRLFQSLCGFDGTVNKFHFSKSVCFTWTVSLAFLSSALVASRVLLSLFVFKRSINRLLRIIIVIFLRKTKYNEILSTAIQFHLKMWKAQPLK